MVTRKYFHCIKCVKKLYIHSNNEYVTRRSRFKKTLSSLVQVICPVNSHYLRHYYLASS